MANVRSASARPNPQDSSKTYALCRAEPWFEVPGAIASNSRRSLEPAAGTSPSAIRSAAATRMPTTTTVTTVFPACHLIVALLVARPSDISLVVSSGLRACD